MSLSPIDGWKQSSVRTKGPDLSPLEMAPRSSAASPHPVGQHILDRRTGVEGPEHANCGDGGARELGRDVQSDAGKAEHMDFQHFPGSTRSFKIFAAIVTQTKVQPLADCGLPDHVGVPFELIANCRPDEIGPIRVETFLHHQIDLPEIDMTEIDRDLLAVSGFWTEVMYIRSHAFHPYIICLDGIWMAPDLFQEGCPQKVAETNSRKILVLGLYSS
jgi:hypothetical protein